MQDCCFFYDSSKTLNQLFQLHNMTYNRSELFLPLFLWFVWSSDLKVLINTEVASDSIFSQIEQSDDATWWVVRVASKWNGVLHELYCLLIGHIFLPVLVEVANNESGARARVSVLAFVPEAGLVDRVDLVALVRVPSWADHRGRKWASIVVNDFAHHGSSWFDGRGPA